MLSGLGTNSAILFRWIVFRFEKKTAMSGLEKWEDLMWDRVPHLVKYTRYKRNLQKIINFPEFREFTEYFGIALRFFFIMVQ